MSTLEGIKMFQLLVSLPRTADNLGTPTSRAISVIEAITSAFPVPWEQQADSIGGDTEQSGTGCGGQRDGQFVTLSHELS